MGWDYSLSASKLNVLNECPRCFWDLNAAKSEVRAKTPFPSLPNGIDRVLKGYADRFRGQPHPLLAGQIEPEPVLWGTSEQITKLRHWNSGLKTIVETAHGAASIIGALDDLLVWPGTGLHASLDYKTKGDRPKDDGAQYYQTQIDIYDLLLARNRMPSSSVGYLLYAWPTDLTDGAGIAFEYQLYQLTARQDRAVELIQKATSILAGDRPEASSPGCPHCLAYDLRSQLEEDVMERVSSGQRLE